MVTSAENSWLNGEVRNNKLEKKTFRYLSRKLHLDKANELLSELNEIHNSAQLTTTQKIGLMIDLQKRGIGDFLTKAGRKKNKQTRSVADLDNDDNIGETTKEEDPNAILKETPQPIAETVFEQSTVDTKSDPKEIVIGDAWTDEEKAAFDEEFAAGQKKKSSAEVDEKETPALSEQIEAELRKNMEDARAEYAKADYEASKKQSMFKRVLGLNTDTMGVDNVRASYGLYRQALQRFSNHRIQEAKESFGGFDNNARNILKYFDTDEKLNLYEARTNARTQAWEGKMGGKIMEKAGNFVNWYRKQNVFAKGAVGVALAMSGLGAAALGMRAVGGAATGVGVTAGLEARYRKQEASKAEANREGAMQQLEGVEMEQKFDALSAMLNAEMATYHESLQDEKSKATRHKLIGAGVGVFIGSGAMSEIMGKFFHTVGDTQSVKDASAFLGDKLHGLFGGAAKAIHDGSDKLFSSMHEGTPDNHELLSMHNHAPHFTVEKGSSLEGSIIKYLKTTGISAEDAGSKAHRMVLEYAKLNGSANGVDDFSLIHPGASVTLVPGGSEGFHLVEAFDEKGIGNFDDVISPETSKIIMPNGDGRIDSITVSDASIDHVGQDALKAYAQVSSEGIEFDNYIKSVTASFEETAVRSDAIFTAHPEFSHIEGADYGNAISAMEKNTAESYNPESMQKLQDLRDLQSVFKERYIKMWKTLMGANFDQANLDMNAQEYVRANQGKDKIIKVFKVLQERMSPEELSATKSLNPNSDETVAEWSKRLTNFTLKKISK